MAVEESREEASGTGAEEVGQLVEGVAAALEIVHLQDFDEAAVEDAEAGGDDGCRPFVADADGTEEADEEAQKCFPADSGSDNASSLRDDCCCLRCDTEYRHAEYRKET